MRFVLPSVDLADLGRSSAAPVHLLVVFVWVSANLNPAIWEKGRGARVAKFKRMRGAEYKPAPSEN